eukprot:c5597_g1_i2 orf=114-773(+)
MPSEILSIQPTELKFPFELKKQVSCSIQLFNTTIYYVAFKVRTTSPKKYSVRPNIGVVPPQSICIVTVTMQAQREAPLDMQCKDKFLVQSVIAPTGATSKDISQDMFNLEDGKEVFESKLRVVYVSPPRPPSPVHESPDEGISPRSSSVVDYGHHTFFGYESAPKDTSELKAKLAEASMTMKTAGKTAMEWSKSASGFSFLFVFIVGILGLLAGYLLHL